MDIQVSSNFERLLWHLAHDTSEASDRAADAGRQVQAWMQALKTHGSMAVTPAQWELARRDFSAERVSDAETRATIRRYFDEQSYLVDPHTAVGFEAARRRANTAPQVILSTAHPAKFSDAVLSSFADHRDMASYFDAHVLPPEMQGLLDKPRRVVHIPAGDDHFASLLQRTKDQIERDGFTSTNAS